MPAILILYSTVDGHTLTICRTIKERVERSGHTVTLANIEDAGTVAPKDFDKVVIGIGNNVSIAHNAIVHGCTIHDNVLVGMGAIVMDNCYVEKNALIAAGAVVLENTRVEAGSIYAGVPAKKVKQVSEEVFKDQNERIANNYLKYSSWFK